MPLALLVGPANAGKVARLLDRYLETIDREPVLVVPNRFDRERVERDLLGRRQALFGGSIGTFDDLFAGIARGNGGHRPVATDTQRALVLKRALAATPLNGLSASARYSGFASGLLAVISELEGGLLRPEDVEGELGPLYSAYVAELDRFGLWDRELERRYAVERVENELSAWDGRPVFAYGFEDLTGAQWSLLRALAGRTDVTVSLPYEPGRPAFASLAATMDDLSQTGAVYWRVERKKDSLEAQISEDGESFFTIRQGYFPPYVEVQVGVMCAAPEGPGFEAVFDDLRLEKP